MGTTALRLWCVHAPFHPKETSNLTGRDGGLDVGGGEGQLESLLSGVLDEGTGRT